MDLDKIQREHAEWVARNFPEQELEEAIFGMVEEIGELAHHHLKRKQGIRGDRDTHTEQMIDCIGDCFIFALGACDELGVKMSHVIEGTWAEVRKRDWVADPFGGVSEDPSA